MLEWKDLLLATGLTGQPLRGPIQQSLVKDPTSVYRCSLNLLPRKYRSPGPTGSPVEEEEVASEKKKLHQRRRFSSSSSSSSRSSVSSSRGKSEV